MSIVRTTQDSMLKLNADDTGWDSEEAYMSGAELDDDLGHVGHLAPGMLARIMEVPLDILFEIFGHLHPLDLLHLTRTTKTLRNVLLQRSCAYIWKNSLANVQGLPRCPVDLSEPQYVNLAFDDHCHFCLAPGVEQIYWGCRVRCCKRCVDRQFVSDFELKQRIPHDPSNHKFRAIFPFIVYPKPRPYKPGRILYYLPIADQYIRELAGIDGSEMTVKEWSKDKREEQDRRLTHAALCESWSGHWVERRAAELNLLLILLLSILLAVLWRENM